MSFPSSFPPVFAGLLAVVVWPCLGAAVEAPPIEERLARIERGLVSPLRLEGEPISQRTLGDAMAEEGVPSVALAIVDRCTVVWSGGWGTMEDSETPITGETPFQVGSVSKSVAATVAMLLAAEGELGLDDPVNDRLKTWKLPDNELTREAPVRVRHLLTSSAGLTRTAFSLQRGGPIPPIPALLSGETGGPAVVVEEPTGERAVPSNAGSLLLQHLLEEVTGAPLADLADRLLFQPLGMNDTTFEPIDAALLQRAASGHDRDGTAIEGKAPLVPAAPGGLWASAEDLGRWLAALMASWHGRDGSLLPRPVARRMLSAQLGDMGLGVHVRGDGEAASFQQAGGGIGSSSRIVAYPERCQGAALVLGTDRGRRLVAETLAAVGSEYDWPELPLRVAPTRVPLERLERFTGRYEYDAAPGNFLVFSLDGDILLARSGDRPASPVLPVSDDVFVVPRNATEMRFDVADDGPSPGVTVGTAGLYGYHLSRVD